MLLLAPRRVVAALTLLVLSLGCDAKPGPTSSAKGGPKSATPKDAPPTDGGKQSPPTASGGREDAKASAQAFATLIQDGTLKPDQLLPSYAAAMYEPITAEEVRQGYGAKVQDWINARGASVPDLAGKLTVDEAASFGTALVAKGSIAGHPDGHFTMVLVGPEPVSRKVGLFLRAPRSVTVEGPASLEQAVAVAFVESLLHNDLRAAEALMAKPLKVELGGETAAPPGFSRAFLRAKLGGFRPTGSKGTLKAGADNTFTGDLAGQAFTLKVGPGEGGMPLVTQYSAK